MSRAYQDIVRDYEKINAQIGILDKEKDALKEEAAEALHANGINEISVNVDGKDWFIGYQNKETLSANYALLFETVGEDKYSEIVTVKDSTFITIRKSGKKKDFNEKLKTMPRPDNKRQKAPSGAVI